MAPIFNPHRQILLELKREKRAIRMQIYLLLPVLTKNSHLYSSRRISWLTVDSDVLLGFVEILQPWQPAGEKKPLRYNKACR